MAEHDHPALPDDDDDDVALTRLEAALDRIAQLGSRPGDIAYAPSDATADVAARLDSLIGQLRAALAEHEA